jgi:glycosyltransferase involved in cell wall biosynthesis
VGAIPSTNNNNKPIGWVMQLSIIIPVYNVEAYIEKCITSLQQQDIEQGNYEIIIINDGSPDNSREVVISLMKIYSNIVFIDQENKGVSLARNAGMDKAIGKYLLFIDPDDYVAPNSFARVLKAADEQQAEVTFLGFKFLKYDGSVRKEMFFSEFKGHLFTGIEGYYNARKNVTIDPDRAWAILFDRAFVNKQLVRYIPDVPYLEDGEFLARILCVTTRCIFEGNAFYMRTTRPGSATNSSLFYSDKSINGFIKAAANLKAFAAYKQLSKAQQIFLNQPIAKFVLLAIEASASITNWQKTLFVKKELESNNVGKLLTEGVLQPYTNYAKLYNTSPFLFLGYLQYKKIVLSIQLRFFKKV